MEETKYFLTVDWCNQGKRGIFTDKQGIGFFKDESPHTKREMVEILGCFAIILNPKSELYTETQCQKNLRWIPLAEYQHQYGILIEV